MNLNDCTLCPLSENLLAGCTPFHSYGSGDVLIIGTKPTDDEALIAEPCSAEYDFLKRIVPYDFKYNFLTRCPGMATSDNKRTCIKNWLIPEAEKYKKIFGLGIEVCYPILKGTIKSNTKINDIINKKYSLNGVDFYPTYSLNFVLNRGKGITDRFRNRFNEAS